MDSLLVDKETKAILEKIEASKINAVYFEQNEFKPQNHYYPKVLKSKINSIGSSFFKLSNTKILSRYSKLNPLIDISALGSYLNYKPKYLKWAGCDCFNVTDKNSKRQMIIIETNSCPSGIKSMPLLDDRNKLGAYKLLIESIYEDSLSSLDKSIGDLAVVYDQNLMESSGYCTSLAEISKERVWLVEYLDGSRSTKWINELLFVRDKHDTWHPIRACLRFVTQQPWQKIPINSKTVIINPIVSCLAGGRNKIIASYAYKLFNDEQLLNSSNLVIRQPYSLINVNKQDIPGILGENSVLNKKAVIKVPYGNCGQGVYTIINDLELSNFMASEHKYEKFIVQSLIGDYKWSSGEYFHIGTLPNKTVDDIYVYDLRMIVTSNKSGFFPLSVNCRRARKPLVNDLDAIESSWDLLGTNLSVKIDSNNWDTEEDRLLIMDDADFGLLGLNIDDLIDAYIQTVLSVIAIDKLCISLFSEGDTSMFNFDRFEELNPDKSLLKEISKF